MQVNLDCTQRLTVAERWVGEKEICDREKWVGEKGNCDRAV